MVEIGEHLSFAVGLALIFASAAGIYAFVPAATGKQMTWTRTLARAVTFILMGTLLNALYWQFLWSVVNVYSPERIATFRIWGKYGDVLFKGSQVVGVYLYLKAWHMTLDEPERSQWWPIFMMLYPDRMEFPIRIMRMIINRKKQKERTDAGS